MSLVINNNLMAANTARNLNTHYGRLATSTQRLSSGLRINGAADDAAGLAIRELMRADVAALHQGVRNANDAISMIQVVDGALGIIDEKLIRMKELAEQAATGTYNSTQRLMIDSEFQAMASEIHRIAVATDFNGIKLLDGKFRFKDVPSDITKETVQNSTYTSYEICQKIKDGYTRENPDGFYEYYITKHLTEENIIINESTNYILNNDKINEEKILETKKIVNSIDEQIYVDSCAIAMNWWTRALFFDWTIELVNYDSLENFLGGHNYIFTNYNMLDITHKVVNDVSDMYFNTANKTYRNLTTISVDIDNDNVEDLRFNAVCSLNMDIVTPPHDYDIGFRLKKRIIAENSKEEIISDKKTYKDVTEIYKDREPVKIHFGPMNDSAEDYYYIEKRDCTLKGLGLEDTRIETQDNAQKALVTINDAIVKKDEARAYYGAMQNRLENTVSNLTIQAENLQASESRISDVDVATEMTNFVRNQILTQSAVAMLSQANTLPQMAMQLIGG